MTKKRTINENPKFYLHNRYQKHLNLKSTKRKLQAKNKTNGLF